MTRTRTLASLVLLVALGGLARADGLLYQLPKDGTWATYDVNVSAKGPNDMNMEMKGTLRLASVGQATEKDRPCRWIEIQFDMTMAMGEHKMDQSEAYKLLIPEKYLAKGESPLDHVVRAWTQHGKGEMKKLDNPNDIDAGPLPIILSAPWKDVKQLAKAETESKLGKVACEGVEGSLEFKASKIGVMKAKFENRLSTESPFGVVASRWTIQPPDDTPAKMGDMVWKLKLTDFGSDAKTKMPDAK
jgi:hypothetical protein